MKTQSLSHAIPLPAIAGVYLLAMGCGAGVAAPAGDSDTLQSRYRHLHQNPELSLQTLVSRERPPLESAVVMVSSIHGGTMHNIGPDDFRKIYSAHSAGGKQHA